MHFQDIIFVINLERMIILKRKIISFVLCLVLVLSMTIVSKAQVAELFSDVPPSHWAFKDVSKLQNLNAISGGGNGNFNPNSNITREQFLKILIDGFCISKQDTDISFEDVKSGAWYETYVKTGIAMGIVNGKSESAFGIGENITRQDACVMLLRAMVTAPDSEANINFADSSEISAYAKDAVAFLTQKGIISGFNDNTFRPRELCTKAQAAKIISAAIDVENTYFDGKRKIVFMGDSITNAAEYLIYINAFLKTRFPNEKIEVLFAGDDGATVANMIGRYEDDVIAKGATEAFILFGANDVNRGLYPNGSEEQKAKAIETTTANFETLIGKLKADGIRNVTVLTPPVIDERDYAGAASNKREGVSEGIRKIADNQTEIAKKNGLKVVDLTSATAEILKARKDSGKVEIYKTDRIHPNRVGHFVIANEIIQTLYGSYGLVASVDIDAVSGSYKADNANVTELNTDNGAISYTYNAKALPMGIDTHDITEGVAGNGYTDAENAYPEFVDFTEKMNREIIKVTGLSEGTYEIAFDGKAVTTATAEELAKGINIAVLSENPGQIKAKSVIDSYMKDYWTQIKVRRCETRFTILKKEGMIAADKPTLSQWIDATYPEGNALRAYWTSFLGMYEDYDMYKAQWDRLERNAYKLAQPGTYKVTITKINE